jgi:hypothetical protein
MVWKWIIVLLTALDAGYMVFDGTRALVVGDYLTPSSGPHAGRLGPWASLVRGVGIDPRSTSMKAFFLAYGLAWLAAAACFAAGVRGAWWAMLILAAASLWYLVPGTVLGVSILVLLLLPAVRRAYLR